MKWATRLFIVFREIAIITRKSGIKSAIRKIKQRVYYVHHALLFSKEGPFPRFELPPKVQIRVIPPEAGKQNRQELIEAGIGTDILNFDRGAICYIAYVEGQFAGIGWRFQESRLLRRLKLNEYGIYLGGFFVRKPFRGRGLYPLLLRIICNESLSSDQIALVEVSEQNHASLRGLAKAGFTLKGRLHVTALAGWTIGCKLTNATPCGDPGLLGTKSN
jgi:GNAT superfamily N-acetyltransferase